MNDKEEKVQLQYFNPEYQQLAKLLTHYNDKLKQNRDRVTSGPTLEILKKSNDPDLAPLTKSFLGLCALVTLAPSVLVSPISALIYKFKGHTLTNRIKPIKELMDIIKEVQNPTEPAFSDLCSSLHGRYIKATSTIHAEKSDSLEYKRLRDIIETLDQHFNKVPESDSNLDQPETESLETGNEGNDEHSIRLR